MRRGALGDEGQAALPGATLAYRDLGGDGQGAAIVALHGLGAHADFWQPLAAAARERGWPGRFVAVDLPGHGRSADFERYSDVAYADAVVGLLDALGLRAPVLLGHSLGATVALRAAGRLDPLPAATVGMEIKTRWSAEELARMHAYAAAPRKVLAPAEARARFLRASGAAEAPAEWHDLLVARGVRAEGEGAVLAADPRAFAVEPPDLPALAAAARSPVLLVRAAGTDATTDEDARAVGPPVRTVPGGHNAHLSSSAALWAVVAEVAGA